MTTTKPTACLVSTGEEVLRGEIFDTNNHFLANTLAEHGYDIQLMMTAGDRREDLLFVLRTGLARADHIFISGGLGPTDDDLTAEVAAELAGCDRAFHAPSWQDIVALFQKYGLDVTENNRKQAMIPVGARVLRNLHGTAPGFSLSFDMGGVAKTINAFPGPPRELQPMLLAYLASQPQPPRAAEDHLHIRFLGIGESHVSEVLEPWSAEWGPVSFRQAFPEIEVKLYQPAADRRRALCTFVAQHLADYLVDYSNASTTELFARFMAERGGTLAVAEAGTGGLAAKTITDASGAAAYFVAGVVVGAVGDGDALVGTPALDLYAGGRASEPVARWLATRLRERCGADLVLSFGDLDGDEGADSPISRLWIAKADASGCEAQQLTLLQGRARVRQAAVAQGMRWLMSDWLLERRRRALAE